MKHIDLFSVAQYHAQKGWLILEHRVLDELVLSEAVHEEGDTAARRAHRFRQDLLIVVQDLRDSEPLKEKVMLM
jgi:hypothetical protein